MNEAMQTLNAMIGLSSVKEDLRRILLVREHAPDACPGHYIFSGNPGTGKTAVARLFGDILHSKGLLARGHVVEVTKADLVSIYVGDSAIKTLAKCEEALDGVLFVDEAYELVNTNEGESSTFSSSFDEEAYTTLMTFMENNRKRICVICAGYPDKMRRFMEANPGTKSRMEIIEFPDYSANELFEILKLMLPQKTNLEITDSYLAASKKAMQRMWDNRDEYFGNARDIRTYIDLCIRNAGARIGDSKGAKISLLPEDIPDQYLEIDLTSEERKRRQEDAWAKLDRFIGLSSIKRELQKTIKTRCHASGENNAPGHYIFAGNPGTGKTEVAKLVAEILFANGLLKTNRTVEVKAKDLIGQYVGQTVPKTIEQCRKALDGVLFVDEAYELVDSSTGGNSSSFAQEAYNAIMDFMENNRKRICVIFAGYSDRMADFTRANPGMSSRIDKTIVFPDYSDDELMEMLQLMIGQNTRYNIVATEGFTDASRRYLPTLKALKGNVFGNGRDIRKYLDACIENAVMRIPDEGLNRGADGRVTIELTDADIPGAENARTQELDDVLCGDIYFELVDKSLFTALPDPFDGMSEEERSLTIQRATLRIVSKNGNTATAFIISPDGYAITCAHVVSSGEDLSKISTEGSAFYVSYGDETQGDQKISYCVVNIKPDLDMALIKLEASFDLPYLKIADENRILKLREPCGLYVFPLGGSGNKALECTLASLEEDESIYKKSGGQGAIVFLDGLAFQGGSGGPIVADSDNLVVGIFRGALGNLDYKVNYMSPIKYFWKEFTQ